MSQSSINAGGQVIGVPGQLIDSGPHDIVTGFNEETTQMPFGYGLRQGTSADYYKLATGMSSSSQKAIVGVNAFSLDHSRAGAVDSAGHYAGDLGASGLLQYANLQVVRRGRVLVPVEAAVSVEDRAWCRGVATGNLSPGVWRGVAAGAADPLGGSYHVNCTNQAVFRTASFTGPDGSTLVAVLECDFTNKQ